VGGLSRRRTFFADFEIRRHILGLSCVIQVEARKDAGQESNQDGKPKSQQEKESAGNLLG
jgi:hypothetical protein